MLSWFLKYRLIRIQARANPRREDERFVHAALEKAGFLPARASLYFAWRTALATTIVAVLLSSAAVSYAYASDDVLPRTPLYSIRQTVEDVAEQMVPQNLKSRIQAQNVERRIKEAHLLVAKKQPLPAFHRQLLLRPERVSSTRALALETMRQKREGIKQAQASSTQALKK